MSPTMIKTVDVPLTQSDVTYILHALRELKAALHAKIEADPDGDLVHAYANDVMQARSIHEMLAAAAIPVFGEKVLEFSYDEI
jgi:hypothetical protein